MLVRSLSNQSRPQLTRRCTDCLARKGNEFDAMRQRHMNEDVRDAVVANLIRHQRDASGGASDFG